MQPHQTGDRVPQDEIGHSWERRNLPQTRQDPGGEGRVRDRTGLRPLTDSTFLLETGPEIILDTRNPQQLRGSSRRSSAKARTAGDVLDSGISVAQHRQEPQNNRPQVILVWAIKAH